MTSLIAQKNRNRFSTTIDVPITPELEATLVAAKVGQGTFLPTSFGKEGLRNKMLERSVEAGLKGCSSHDLRKAAAVLMAEAQAMAHEMCAVRG